MKSRNEKYSLNRTLTKLSHTEFSDLRIRPSFTVNSDLEYFYEFKNGKLKKFKKKSKEMDSDEDMNPESTNIQIISDFEEYLFKN